MKDYGTKDVASILQAIREEPASPAVMRENREPLDDTKLGMLVTTIGESICPGFVMDAGNGPALIAFAKWVNAQPFVAMRVEDGRISPVEGDKRRGIYLTGKTGSGKTVATRVMRDLAGYLGVRVKLDGAGCRFLCNWTEARADEITAEVMRTGDVSRFVDAPVLCIQDLGSEPVEVMFMGNRIEPLRQILERRGDIPGRITIVTSNVLIGDNAKRYGERVQSRLYAMCNLIVMQGGDRRAK